MGQRFRPTGMAGQFQQILAVTLLCEVFSNVSPVLLWFCQFTSHNTLLSIIDSACHPCYKYRQTVLDSLLDFLSQSCFDLYFRPDELLRPVSCEAAPVHSLFFFR